MTYIVNQTASRIVYTATAGQTEFALSFEFSDVEDLAVYREGTLLTETDSPADNTEYSVTGAASNGTKKITLGAPGANAGDEILIFRQIPAERLSNFPASGPFSVASLNAELNRLTMQVYDLRQQITGRTLNLSAADSPSTLTSLPALSLRAGYLLGFDSDGNPKAYSAGELSDQYAQVVARMRVVNPMEDRFGAIGDGATNDDDALDAALAELVAGGGILQLTNLHRITGAREITSDHPVAIVGNSPYSSGFVHSGNTDPITITVSTWGDWAPRIENVGFWKTGSGTTSTALTLRSETWLGDAESETSGSAKGATILGCIFDTAEGETGYWRDGIYLHNMPHTLITQCWVKGRGATTTEKQGYGVKLGHYVNGASIINNKIRGFEKGIGTYEAEFLDQPARANSTAYVVGDRITVSTGTAVRYVFTCETAGTSAASEPAGYATIGQNDDITDGTAVFNCSGYQSEGVNIYGNTVQACHSGVHVDLGDPEISWLVFGNGFDCANHSVYFRNMIGSVIANNLMGWNDTSKHHIDIVVQMDDGAAVPVKAADNVVSIITGNYCFRGGDMSLNVTGVTRGATTVIAYSKSASADAPASGDYIFLANLGGTTEVNNKPWIVTNHTALSSTTGTFEILDYYSGAAVNSSGYGAWTSGGNVSLFSAFLEVRGGQEIVAQGNFMASRSCGLHLWAATQDIAWLDNRRLSSNMLRIISASSAPETLRWRSDSDEMQIRQSASYTLTSSTSAQKLFNAVVNGAFTLETGDVVDMDLLVGLTSLSAVSSDFSFGLAGTAVLSEIALKTEGMKNTSPNASRAGFKSSAAASSVVNATTGTEGFMAVRGSFKVTTGGTVIPQITLGDAAAAVVAAGSYCRMKRQPPVQNYGVVS